MSSIREYILIFLLGFFSCILIFIIINGNITGFIIADAVEDIKTPSDRLNNEDVIVLNNSLILNISNAKLGNYEATKSMIPVLDENTTGIKIIPKTESDIKEGDIISFSYNNDFIVHRIIEKGTDKKGVYFVTKGDNSNIKDSKLRFEDIKYVTIGVLW